MTDDPRLAGLSGSRLRIAQRMIEAGHTPELNEDGVVDFWAYDGDYHNGPSCEVCSDSVCEHCEPDWHPDPCPGQEEVDRRYRAHRYEQFLRLKAEFEP